jgi:hypothetical protein
MGTTVSKFKIGQSVRLRSSVQAGRGLGGEYRIVGQLPPTDSIIRYRVRSSADEHDEVVVKESDLHGWQVSKTRAHRSTR